MATLDFPPNPRPGDQYPALGLIWTWDGFKWTASTTAITGIPDAPNDGQNYGRQYSVGLGSMSWIPTGAGGGVVTEAPINSTTYARNNGIWVHIKSADISDLAANVPLASTAFPQPDGTATPGSSGKWADGAHVHPTDTTLAPKLSPTFSGIVTIPLGASIAGYAPLVSPAFLGVPTTATNPTPGVNDTTLATCFFVNAAVRGGAYTLPIASTTILGGVMVDGTTVTVAGGVISATAGARPSTFPPNMDGTQNVGSDIGHFALADHTHPTDVSRASASALSTYLPLTGGVLSGSLTLASDPTASLGAATKQYVDGRLFPNANLLDNGDMVINQRGLASITTPNSVVMPAFDRWWAAGSTVGSHFTAGQNHGIAQAPPVGFPNYLGCVVTSAFTQTTTSWFGFEQTINGQDAAPLGWGAAGGQSVTLSFWAISSLTGNFSGAIYNGTATSTRSFTFIFTLAAPNTWTKFSVTIPPDNTGTWTGGADGGALTVFFSLGAGSTLQTGAGVWTAGTFFAAPSTINVVGTNSATFGVTGAKLEIGSAATSWVEETYAQKLLRCVLYYQQLNNIQFSGTGGAGTAFTNTFTFLGPMWGPPTAAFTSTSGLVNCSSPSVTATDAGAGYAQATIGVLGAASFSAVLSLSSEI